MNLILDIETILSHPITMVDNNNNWYFEIISSTSKCGSFDVYQIELTNKA